MKILAVGIAFLAVVIVCSGKNPNGILYPFEINDLLTCHVDNPLDGPSIPESILQLSFTQVVTQEDHPNVIWLPENTSFRIPPGGPDIQRLLDFLGDDFNPLVSSVSRPTTTPPFTCEVSGSRGGSGDGFISHVATSQTGTPLLSDTGSALSVNFQQLVNDPSKDLLSEVINLERQRLNITHNVLINEINNQPALCEIHTGLCPLSTVWAELPNGYFPKFFAQGTCSNKNCSHPRGKLCEEDFSYTSYVTVLRWDCCFNKELSQIRWDCGWRKVQVPAICECSCACGEVFHNK